MHPTRARFPFRWLVLFPVVALLPSPAALAGYFSVALVPSHSEGDYGTGTSTTIDYVPLVLKYRDEQLSVKLTVPYLSISTAATATSAKTTDSGLGDVWFETRYRTALGRTGVDLVPYAKLKFGTASYAKYLGTGENDYEAGLGMEWSMGRSFYPFVTAGYRVVGNPPGANLHNIATYDGGVTYAASVSHSFTVMLAGQQAQSQSAVTPSPAPEDLWFTWNYRARGGIGLQAFYAHGLSTGSPTHTIGAGIEKRF